MSRRFAVAIVVLSLSSSTLADTHGKRSWEWSSAERIRARTEAGTIARLSIPARGSGLPGSAVVGNAVVRIDGRENPELFLPLEVFRNFLSGWGMADEHGKDILQQAYLPVVARLELGGRFLEELALLANNYLSREAELRTANASITATKDEAARARLRNERDALTSTQCRELQDALRRARQRFGEERFNRFLYEAIAPGMVVTLAGPENRDSLAAWERDCR